MKSLTAGDALALLKKYNVSQAVLEHILSVRDYAVEIASKKDCDRQLVEVGALLHDIGRSRTHKIDHAIIGASILRKEGIDPKVVNIVEKHIGAGLTASEAKKLGLPEKDFIPGTIEEKIVAHADNLIGSTERVSIKDTVKMAKEKWFEDSVKRLIDFHYEVFEPENVIFGERIYADKDNALDTISGYVDKLIKKEDVLYRLSIHDGRCIISLYGGGAERSRDILKEAIGIPEKIGIGNIYTAEISRFEDDGFFVYASKEYFIDAESLYTAFNIKSVNELIKSYGLIKNMPVQVRITGENSAMLSEEQVNIMKEWAESKHDMIIVTGITRAHLKRSLKKLKISGNVSDVERLGILCQMIACKKGISGYQVIQTLRKKINNEMSIITAKRNKT
jgi:uncharacterized protein (TIGR00295 family)